MIAESNQIVTSTLELAREVGWSRVSVRAIAKKIGYSTIKIYSEFGSKDGLLVEIQNRGFRQLRAHYLAASDKGKSAAHTLEEIALAHVQFALDNPTLYPLMFGNLYPGCQEESRQSKREAGGEILKVIQALTQESPQIAFLQFFSMLTGFVSLYEELGENWPAPPQAIIRTFVQNFIHGIQ